MTTEADIPKSDKKTIQVEFPLSATPDQTIQQEATPDQTIQQEATPDQTIQREGKKSLQRMTPSGRIYVSKKGWLLRLTILSLLIGNTANFIIFGVKNNNTLVIFSTMMLIYSVLVLAVGWFCFKSKIATNLDNGLVSVIIPIYNQKNMIKVAIEAVFASSYKNIEVIAVNDGSIDGTKDILDELSKRFSNLKVIHQTNQGKRKAVAKGFRNSKGKFMILMDSDSVLAENAIAHIVGTFTSNPKVGAIAGHAKLWNASKNFLTKLQDPWYDYSFNIVRATESVFGSVQCCPGCLSGYRRETIAGFMKYWSTSDYDDSQYQMLTSYAYAPTDVKTYISHTNVKLSAFAQKQMESAAEYDDADDRILTAQSLSQEWQTVFVPTAIAYTEVPQTWKAFLKQLLRWKKAYVRTSLFVSSFFWKRSTHPLMTFLFYIELMSMYIAPLVIAIAYFYEPFIVGDFYYPLLISIAIMLMGLAQGLDYRSRDPGARYWFLQGLMTFIQLFLQPYLLISAIIQIRKNNWMTR